MFYQLVSQVGFNGGLVVLLLFMGRELLKRMFNHWGDIHKEMKKQTFIMGLLYEHQTGKKLEHLNYGKGD